MTDSLYNRVMSLIPSGSLKKQISLSGFHASDQDLLSIVWNNAPDYETRLALLRELEQSFSGEIKEYTSRLIHRERQMLESFITPEENAVYELYIKETPHAYEERYICRSYEDALRMIPLFYQEYGGTENASSRYRIEKRRILSEETGFSEDALGDMYLHPGMKIYSVSVYAFDFQAEECEGVDCEDCHKPCKNHNVRFPLFARHGDAVRCRYWGESAEEEYGIVLVEEDAPCVDYYVIPLDSNSIRHHDFINIYDAHRHVPAPLMERIEPDTLPGKMKKDYLACRQYVLENVRGF